MKALKFVPIQIAILMLLLVSCSASSGAEIKIKAWEALYSQDMVLENIRGMTGWQPVKDLASLELPYPHEYTYQYMWIRGECIIKDEPSQYFGITLGRVYHLDRVFVNGTEVGSTLPEEFTSLHYPRSYRIPAGVLVRGRNVVYIQVGIFGGKYGGIFGDIAIRDRDGFKKKQLLENIIFQQMPVGLMFFLFIAMIVLFMFFILNRREKIFLFTAMLSAYYLFYLIYTFQPVQIFQVDTLIALHWSAVPSFAIFIILLLQSTYKVYLNTYNRILIPLLLGCLAMIMLSGNELSGFFAGRILGALCVLILYPFFLFMAVRINRIKPDPFKFYFFIGFVIITWSYISFEVYHGLMGNYKKSLLSTYLSPLYITCITFFIARDFQKRWLGMEFLYSELKTRESGSGQVLPITDTTKEKLQQVIDFINKNYVSDISREGLAAAIDMNPDYMSRVFKSFTGKKINDYINDKRIEEALKIIRDSDKSITEIAFSVGFESLTTFNRIFKRVVGTTPSKLREST